MVYKYMYLSLICTRYSSECTLKGIISTFSLYVLVFYQLIDVLISYFYYLQIFTLSAIPFDIMPTTIEQCVSVLKPGGLLLFRDYGTGSHTTV